MPSKMASVKGAVAVALPVALIAAAATARADAGMHYSHSES